MTVGNGRRRIATSPGLAVSVTDGLGRNVRDPGLRRWLARVAPPRTHGTVTIALVSDAAIRRLNRRYAGEDRVTDVLSFPSAGPDPAGPKPGTPHLGDVAIGVGRARRQALAAGHALRTELRLLALHGLLHLLGYDHHADRGRMARLESRLRRTGGLREGLIERAEGS